MGGSDAPRWPRTNEPVAAVRSVRPTRRGAAVLVVSVVAFLVGVAAGPRSLNAVVVPALVLLGVGLVQVVAADPPTIERTTPRPGFPGEERTVRARVASPLACRVDERVGQGLEATETVGSVGAGGTLRYRVRLCDRGEHELGPARCRLSDTFGLFARHLETEGTGSALVFPPVRSLHGGHVAQVAADPLADRRDAFDRLRPYHHGDAMRDIHWRASARRTDSEFVVAEYETRGETDSVHVVAESDYWGGDAMAEAAASVVYHLHRAGVDVRLRAPGGRRAAPASRAGLADALELLAHTPHGDVEPSAGSDADVRIEATRGSVTVTTGGRTVPFEDVADESAIPRVEPTEVAT